MSAARLVWPWRRLVQSAVLASIVLFPLLSRYGHYIWARQYEKVEAAWGWSLAGGALRASDALARLGLPMEEAGVKGRRPRKSILKRLEGAVGTPAWSARLLGVSLTDLLAGAESAAASRGVRLTLVLGLLLPLAGTLLLGRVYCGWICPMGLILPAARRLRRLLEFLELPPPAVELWRGNKYLILGSGLAVVLLTGLPLLHHLYPPAVLGREAHSWATVLFDRAENGRFGFPWGAFSGGILFLGALLLVEVALAPGQWCASLCPGGALYSLLSRWKLLEVRRREPACIDCVRCDRACPMALRPMRDDTGPECDACGICLDVCPTRALSFAVKGRGSKEARRAAAALVLLLLAAVAARAHHIIGIPHYAYDESYPQAPVIKLVDRVGPWEVHLTGYPGNPKPGERAEIHAFIKDAKGGFPLDTPVLLEAYRVRVFGFKERILEPSAGLRDMALAKYHVVYPAEGNYELALLLPSVDGGSTLRFPMVVGEPGSPWRDVALFGGGFLGLIVVVRAARIKRRRRAEARA